MRQDEAKPPHKKFTGGGPGARLSMRHCEAFSSLRLAMRPSLDSLTARTSKICTFWTGAKRRSPFASAPVILRPHTASPRHSLTNILFKLDSTFAVLLDRNLVRPLSAGDGERREEVLHALERHEVPRLQGRASNVGKDDNLLVEDERVVRGNRWLASDDVEAGACEASPLDRLDKRVRVDDRSARGSAPLHVLGMGLLTPWPC